ncbi:hypothetical protein HBI56_017400 [Parastagonospora nodorum]|uniref:Uncharacterized protein n=2 Tax=Phaeosphaeria nodorum (strain SN15 / ATCC MYA-4574 / FGSC 10173) TaxID=321614 RepID=Q0V341_PHANO|nr:hypothetical protein SNOG_01573 [Parastagonospora nodorum SN15]KAH3914961.1 hypothetical protein HBH56_082610 [Parastagonospora nodorum]EAT91222.1 hypothetical protein SNOG_01573 [Parastagonospora nodorum SN15]KAH3929775.1 hypothetical protein HBH54_119230 [Parastagonospora nodorum]KAH3955417.1 hypothetical protein HBH53_005340 [Parastagonospora nodorum]KAH3977047.1 hypothetical protein HBH51_076180 [Parastagonospora nodorum]
MTSRYDSSTLYSAFLSLPTEIRCEIYDYLLVDSQSITISAGYITVFGNRIKDRARKHDIPGLPLDLAPLVRQTRDASLLSVAKPPEIAIDNAWMDDVARKDSTIGMPAPLALLLTCRLVNDELTDYMRGRKQIKTARARSANPTAEEAEPTLKDDNEGLSLYVTYPYGVLVLKSMYPYLLKQARRVYISGYYSNPGKSEPSSPTSADGGDEERLTPSSSFAVAESFGAMPSGRSFGQRSMVRTTQRRSSNANANANANPTRPRLRLDPPLQRQERRLSKTEVAFPNFSDETNALAPTALTHLVRTLFPHTPSQCVKLSARILYPGENSYGTVWSDEKSPIVHVLKNVCGGKIAMKVKRGDIGTGLLLTARARPDSRIVSTSWENWTARNGENYPRRGSRMDLGDLDAFLVAEDKKS